MSTLQQTPKRILYIQRPYGGGSSISLLELVKGLNKKKYTPIVLFYQDNVFRERYEKAGIQVISFRDKQSIPDRENGDTNKLYLRSLKEILFTILPLIARIISIIKSHKIDLVHQNLGFDKAAIIASKLTNTPQICHFRHFSKVSRSKHFLSKMVDSGVYISESIKQYYQQQGTNIQSTDVIYNPVAFNNCVRNTSAQHIKNELLIPLKDKVVTSVGRVTPWKGQFYLLKSIETILKNHDYQDIKILMVGTTGDSKEDLDYLDKLKALAETPLLKGKVIFTGQRDDIDRIMSGSDIVIHSAIEPEPFGRVIAEAMAAGTPVIASNAGGVAEIVDNKVTGLLVQPKNQQALAEAIISLLNSKSLSLSLSEKAKVTVENRFSVEKHIECIEALYYRTIKQREVVYPKGSENKKIIKEC